MAKKPSFFERLSGSSHNDTSFDTFDDEMVPVTSQGKGSSRAVMERQATGGAARSEEDGSAGQLPVDVYQTTNEIVVRAFVAGVRPDELSISISRDMVEIEGSRMERDNIADLDYFARELFWGSFSRVIQLPEEVDVDSSAATSKDGLLVIIMPKLDKARQTKLRVKAG